MRRGAPGRSPVGVAVTTPNQPLRPLDDREMADLRASILEHGQHVPVVRHKATGEIIDGHHRVAVCVELGLMPVIVDLDCDEATAEALRLSLNLARRQMSKTELGALQTKLIRTAYPTTAAPRGKGGAGKARVVAKKVGAEIAAKTGRPVADVTPSRREVLAAVRPPDLPARTTAVRARPHVIPTEPTDLSMPLGEATKQQLLARMCELINGTPVQLGQALLERGIAEMENPMQIKVWVEVRLAKALGRYVTVGAVKAS